MKLQQRTVLITGGTSGMGLEWARELLKRGNTVIVTGRDQDRLEATERSLPGVHTFRSDASDPQAIASLREEVLARFPALDTLINNAGIMRNLRFGAAQGPEDVTREIEINLSGSVRTIDQFLPHLLTRSGALIVNVSSGLAFIPFPAAPVYSATKAAIHSFTQSLRAQLQGTRVTIVELAPPGVETPLFRGEFAAETRGQKGNGSEGAGPACDLWDRSGKARNSARPFERIERDEPDRAPVHAQPDGEDVEAQGQPLPPKRMNPQGGGLLQRFEFGHSTRAQLPEPCGDLADDGRFRVSSSYTSAPIRRPSSRVPPALLR